MRVIGVLAPGGMQIGLDLDDLVIVPVRTAMRMFDRTSLFRVLIRSRAHADVDAVCPRAIEILNERHGEEDVTCITQESVVSTLGSILNVLTAALAGIAAVSLAVAGVGIMNLMLVSVSERTPEIGLARAVGASQRQVLGVFLAEAVLLAGLGGLGGLVLGWLAVRVLAWIYPAFPAAIPLWAAGAAFVNALVVGALFGILPARRATRLDPIAALAGK
jgi:putative ABC transport system permease protein